MTPAEIKQRRKELNLTQAAVAKNLGITLRHYQRLESGEVPLTGAMKKIMPLELEYMKRRTMTPQQFNRIKHELTLREIANIIKAMGAKIKIQYPARLQKSEWATPYDINVGKDEILITSHIPDAKYEPNLDYRLMMSLSSCLYDMTDLVRRCKFDEAGQKQFDEITERAIEVLSQTVYAIR